jgi:hypothetical protein
MIHDPTIPLFIGLLVGGVFGWLASSRYRLVEREIPFDKCENPDCPIGCPDSHCLWFDGRQK